MRRSQRKRSAAGAPGEGVPVEVAAAEEVPAKKPTVKKAPVKKAPVKSAPTKEPSAKKAPAKSAPPKEPSAKNAPAKEAPAENAPPPVVHLNAAGAAIPSPATTAKVHEFLDLESKVGAYEMVSKYGKEDMERPYTELATLLNCNPEEISIVSSATEAWNEAVWGVARKLLRKGGTIVTTQSEYGSNYLTYLELKKHFGADIHVLRETDPGEIDVGELESLYHSAWNPRVKMIALPHVPTNSGVVYNLRKVIDAICIERCDDMGWCGLDKRCLYLVDGTQSVGQLPVDVREIGCDILTGTSRKWLRGPRGAGFVYCSEEWRNMFSPATIDVHSARLKGNTSYELNRGSRMFEKYEMSFAAKAGLGIAVAELNQTGIGNVSLRISELAETLRNMLDEVAGVNVEDYGDELCGIVSFTVVDDDDKADRAGTEQLFHALGEARFSVSLSRRSSTPLDMKNRGLDCVIRVSPHVYNTEDELRRLVETIETELARGLPEEEPVVEEDAQREGSDADGYQTVSPELTPTTSMDDDDDDNYEDDDLGDDSEDGHIPFPNEYNVPRHLYKYCR